MAIVPLHARELAEDLFLGCLACMILPAWATGAGSLQSAAWSHERPVQGPLSAGSKISEGFVRPRHHGAHLFAWFGPLEGKEIRKPQQKEATCDAEQ